jgi:transposase-like protein
VVKEKKDKAGEIQMKKTYREMSLIGFQRHFRTEAACRKYLFNLRWPEGFVCPACGSKHYGQISRRNLFQCKACRRQSSLTAGTIMHRTRTPLRIWFWAIYLVANDKRGLSALQLSKKLEVSYYVAWTMLHKIRRAMGERDDNYHLEGIIEADESFFGGGKGGKKRGRGSKKTPVIIEVSTHRDYVDFARMRVLDKVDSQNIKAVLERDVSPQQTIKTDGLPAYYSVKDLGHKHQRKVAHGPQNKELLNWVHTVASNAKAFLLGTFHGIGKKHLQQYLNEFCYRFNRRQWEGQLFDRLVRACATSSGITYAQLTD